MTHNHQANLSKIMVTLAMTFIVFIFSPLARSEDPFPLRKEFPSVKIIEMDELEKKLSSVLLVDPRTAEEYDVIHIEGAHLIPIHNPPLFEKKLTELRAKNGTQTIVF